MSDPQETQKSLPATTEIAISSALITIKQLDLAQSSILAQYRRFSDEINMRVQERAKLSNLVVAVMGGLFALIAFAFPIWHPIEHRDLMRTSSTEPLFFSVIFLVTAGIYNLLFRYFIDHSAHIYTAAIYIDEHLAAKMASVETYCISQASHSDLNVIQNLIPGLFIWESYLNEKRKGKGFTEYGFEVGAITWTMALMYLFFLISYVWYWGAAAASAVLPYMWSVGFMAVLGVLAGFLVIRSVSLHKNWRAVQNILTDFLARTRAEREPDPLATVTRDRLGRRQSG